MPDPTDPTPTPTTVSITCTALADPAVDHATLATALGTLFQTAMTSKVQSYHFDATYSASPTPPAPPAPSPAPIPAPAGPTPPSTA